MDLHTVFKISPDFQRIGYFIPQEERWSPEVSPESGLSFAQRKRKPSLLHGPHSIDFDSEQNFFVTNYYTPGIRVYNASGKLVRSIGNSQSHWALKGPATSFFDKQQRLLVTEYNKNAILAYSSEGDFIGGMGQLSANCISNGFVQSFDFFSTSLVGGFNRPHMVKQSSEGELLCADTWNHRVQKFTSEGHYLSSFSSIHLQHPVSVGFMPNKRLIVTSWGNNALCIFSWQGELIKIIDDLGLNKPYDCQIIDKWVVIADSHNGRILFVCLENLVL